MLTVDFERWPVGPADLVLDVGCGGGRHSFAALKAGAAVVSIDLKPTVLREVADMSAALVESGQVGGQLAATARADVLRLPFPEATFDCVIASEILEHIASDGDAIKEIARVLKPGGRVAVTVPRAWPERVCWALSREYRSSPGGHVRIYRAEELTRKLEGAGLRPRASHHAHALHSPYWWLKCVFGVNNERAPVPRIYHSFLVWELTHRPAFTRLFERALDPLLGKSFVVYLEKEGAK
ncbi:MAG TPA: class I SAM-dependent methyltransferase [Actinomycetota bacterium]|nr:class I SAM-dependent methyltransferase [Actinomycetota bacterium]